MTIELPSEKQATAWPACSHGQVEVMVLGTYHMHNPDLDEVNFEADDVLTEDRQAELQDLVGLLADWEPDRIAVERPYNINEELNHVYRRYRNEEYNYSEEPEFSGDYEEKITDCRSEVVQIGFRLADFLNHEQVVAIEEHPEPKRYRPDPFDSRDISSFPKTPYGDSERPNLDEEDVLRQLSIPEYLARINQESRLRNNHNLMFDRSLRMVDDDFGSPLALTYWYDRNIRMVHHLWRGMSPKDDRLFLIVGSGHVRILRHLLNEAPMFCPVSPRSYLPCKE